MARLPKKERIIHKNDDVLIISGEHKGSEGKVLSIDHKRERVTVEGINQVVKHMRKSSEHPQGARIHREAPIHISNVRRIVRRQKTEDQAKATAGEAHAGRGQEES